MNFDATWVRWTGRIMSWLMIAFFVFDGGIQFLAFDFVLDGMAQMGLPTSLAMPLGAIMLGATLLYAIPQTAVLGAILLTADLGGAVATHLRDTTPVLAHNVIVVLMGAMVWGGLWLRDSRLRALMPWRQN
ncbi:MAG: DoxX family protein [Pseudolabrys sp.]|nr:DoxX family protein [Pseudolabrys sp.]